LKGAKERKRRDKKKCERGEKGEEKSGFGEGMMVGRGDSKEREGKRKK
jgi:hypothetical protein